MAALLLPSSIPFCNPFSNHKVHLLPLHSRYPAPLPRSGGVLRSNSAWKFHATAAGIGTCVPVANLPSEERSLLFDVSGMMCGGCASRVKSILLRDDRIDTAGVNLLTETAAVRLRARGGEDGDMDFVAEDIVKRLTGCGFHAKRRELKTGIGENVKKWREMAEKKEVSLARSRNKVVFSWTLVALCCGGHLSHWLHSAGIHIAHGPLWDAVQNPYVKGAVALIALFGPGRDLLMDGVTAFFKGSPNMNSLVGLGCAAAFIISAVSLLNPGLEWDACFFDEPVMLLGFILLGRSLEERARLKAGSDMNQLFSLISSRSRLVIASPEVDDSAKNVICENAVCIEIPTDDLRIGDSVLILPGEAFPIDGKILAGKSMVDESMLTGESRLVFKEIGHSVSSGTINWDGPLRVEASSTGGTSTICKIIRMVEDAQSREAPIQRTVDKIASWFAYSVMALSATTFVFWYNLGTNLFPEVLLNDFAGSEGSRLLLSLKLAVDVMVVSCPCALGLATPTAILVGTSLGAKQGLLIRGGDVLERLARINLFAFDKTGTLTEGKPSVAAVFSACYKESEILQLAAAVEKAASHPIAKAILNEAGCRNLRIPSTGGHLTEPGSGCLAEVDGSLVAVGRKEWVQGRFQKAGLLELVDFQNQFDHFLENIGSTSVESCSIVYVGRESEGVIGAIVLSDTLRGDAKSTINRLHQNGMRTTLLSGDREEAVASVAGFVGIGHHEVKSCLSPKDKANLILHLQAQGQHVAMVGDGINDAPSLALADVGIAIQNQAKETAASDAASVILLGNRLSQVVDAFELAQATMRKVHQNLAWAVLYNIFAIPVAAGFLLPPFGFAMTPSLSGGLMALSSIIVVTNSLLLQLNGFSTRRTMTSDSPS